MFEKDEEKQEILSDKMKIEYFYDFKMTPGFVTGMLCIDQFCQYAPSARELKVLFLHVSPT